jgi:lysine-specific demethylase 8
MGLIMGADCFREELLEEIKRLEIQHKPTFPHISSIIEACPQLPQSPIKRLHRPSLFEFESLSEPCILSGVVETWPASLKWKDINHLVNICGHRLIAVEVGEHYLHQNWSQSLMTISEFIEKYYLDPLALEKGYLAQYDIFAQIPSLKRDITVPDYCASFPMMHIWWGPGCTKTPLHFDPYDNLLAQIVGYKRIRLFSPECSSFLYPCREPMANNSQVDIDRVDYSAFPLFKESAVIDIVLREGEMLYLPKGWWHHVVSLTKSISVSFWW